MGVLIISEFEFEFGVSNIFCLFVFGVDGGFVYDGICAAFVFHRAVLFVTTVTCASIVVVGFRLQDFSVVLLDDGFHVFGHTIANFNRAAVKYSSQRVVTGEIFVNNFEKLLSNVSF